MKALHARRRAVLPTAVLVLSLTACSDSAPPAGDADGDAVIRDSAGITIVENTAPVWPDAAGWRVADEPTLEIGSALGTDDSDAYQFDGVRDAIRLGNGAIAVADGGSRRIRIYDENGRHVRDMGAHGEGPGEFTALSDIGRAGPRSITAWDGSRKRLTIFDEHGQVSQTTTAESVSGMIVPAVGWFADASVVVVPSPTIFAVMSAEPGERRLADQYLRVLPSGEIDTLAVLQGREEVIVRTGEGVSVRPVLFGRDSYADVGPDAFYAGESGVFEIRRRSPEGDLRRIIRKAGDARPVSEDELATAREKAMANRRESARLLRRPVEEATPPPHRETHPFFDRILVDRTRHLWIRVSGTDDGSRPQKWRVFDPEGVWLGSVSTPAGFDITEIGADYLLGTVRDDLGVDRVRLYALERF